LYLQGLFFFIGNGFPQFFNPQTELKPSFSISFTANQDFPFSFRYTSLLPIFKQNEEMRTSSPHAVQLVSLGLLYSTA